MQLWTIIPLDTPHVLRACPKCGPDARYASSGKFRVNANGRLLDIWLIHRCTRCDNTLNLEIMARTRSGDMAPDLLRRYETNDAQLALAWSLDPGLYRRNRARPSYDHITYRIGKTDSGEAPGFITLASQGELPVRLDRILAEGLGMARSQVQRLFDQGRIAGAHGPLSPSDKLGAGATLQVEAALLPPIEA